MNREHENARFREDAVRQVRRMDTEFLRIFYEEAVRELRLRRVEMEGIHVESTHQCRKTDKRKTGRGKANARRLRKAENAKKGLMENFRKKVLGHASRTGMSDSRFGVMAMGDPSLVRRMRKGGAPRLGTVDRVLAFLGEAPMAPAFLLEVEAFVAVTRTKVSVFSRESSGNQSFLTQLRRGAMPRLDTADRVRAWMRRNCTAGEWDEIRSRVEAELPEPPPGEAPWISAARQTEDGLFDGRERLDAKDAAALAGVSPRILGDYRSSGRGPTFERVGRRVRYLREDVESWIGRRDGVGSGGGRDGSGRDDEV